MANVAVEIGDSAPAKTRLRVKLGAEFAAQGERWFLWAPVAFGAGAALYLSLPHEPPPWLGLAPLLGAIGVAVAWRTGLRLPLLVSLLLTFFAAGAAVGQWRTANVAAPVLSESRVPRVVEGWVVDVASPGAGGARLVIAPSSISRLAPDQLPARVRVTIEPEAVVAPGSAVRLTAILNRSPGPAAPGSYDFARDAFFEQIGAVGFTVREPVPVRLHEPDSLKLRMLLRINALRWSLSERIVARLGPRIGGVAAAMTTGHEAWLSRETLDVMRDSGLAHVLSISGLHMAVVGGFVFFAVRAGLAAWPWAALRTNIKKVAALAGLMAVAGYLVISGSPAPAERAAITASVAFVAILLDRRALSLRALAIAALLVMAFQPEAVIQPGFQMSFAATTALIALAERWPKPIREINTPWPITGVQRALAWVALSAAVSLVAGLATGPFAIQHFNRMASYGLAANLLTAPLSTLMIMPALAVGAVLEPLGLGGPFLWVSGQGIDFMLRCAEMVASWPGAVRTIPSAPPLALPVSFVGILWLCIWEGRLRWLGLPLACAVLLWPRPEPPVGWISESGTNVALVQDGGAVFMRPGRAAFASELWARRRGLELDTGSRLWACNRRICRSLGVRPAIAAGSMRKPPKASEWRALCRGADLVIVRTPGRPPAACRNALVLGPRAFAAGGSAEIFRDGAGWRLVWASERRGDRPWTRR